MPIFEREITLQSQQNVPSIGSIYVSVEVDEFINGCSDEEFEDLVARIKEIVAQTNQTSPPPGLRPLTDEEVKALGLPPIKDKEDNKPTKRKTTSRTSKKRK